MPYFTVTVLFVSLLKKKTALFNENARHFEALIRCTAVDHCSIVGLGDRLDFVGLITLQEQFVFLFACLRF